ncbi:MAG: putative porin [Opitutus sp.]|nr:putative porin [Opitutus sp.]MCS6248266.1 putative porin [Opitutus sp.]MCS6273011.1 putative porin [Opitutus sp.]MCS6276760.1 putative porin [Opitutus sp.]MCS6301591.1 putative porin [Opitutus sp.]
MSASLKNKRRRSVASLAAVCCTLAATAALHGQTAESQPAPLPGIPTAPTANVTINLIRLMVEQKLLPAEAAAKLIAQAEAEAAQASAALAAAAAPKPAPAASELAASAPAGAPGTVRVTYIPPHVRRQMVEEVRAEVMSQAVDERWADPQALPEWATRWKFNGDIRLRYEAVAFPSGNDTSGTFLNFTSLNNGKGFQSNTSATPDELVPFLNVDQDRERPRLRARFGTDVNLEEGFTTGIRLATGESNSPISQNQTLGGGTGNFSKYSVWIDRAYLRHDATVSDTLLTTSLGRLNNPFFGTPMIWSNDLGFDGAMVQARHRASESFTHFGTAGLFPVYNTAFDLSTNQSTKTASADKWLYAVQGGTEWKINKDFEAKFGLAYYHFQNIEGKVSSPTNGEANSAGDTDGSRTLFTQKGNTMMEVRNLTAPSVSTNKQYQYYGLATPFREIALTGRLDYNHFDPIQISLIGEVVKNIALDKAEAAALDLETSNQFKGGDLGFYTAVQVGHAALAQRWDWNVSLGYRYVQTDAVVDGFADSDFGGGGTNVKGFTLGGNFALSSRVWIGARLMSSDQVDGPTYKNETLQFDINGRF